MNLSLKSFYYVETFADHVEQQYHAQAKARHDTVRVSGTLLLIFLHEFDIQILKFFD